MESCHSYFHDILRKMGPTNATDARLQHEKDSFPPEAKVITCSTAALQCSPLTYTDMLAFRKLSKNVVDTGTLS